MTKERFLRPAQYACFIGATLSLGGSIKWISEAEYLDRQFYDQKNVLVLDYRREWAKVQPDQMKQDFIVRTDRFSVLRDSYVEEQIAQNHPEISTVHNTRAKLRGMAGFSALGTLMGMLVGVGILGHRYGKEKANRIIQGITPTTA